MLGMTGHRCGFDPMRPLVGALGLFFLFVGMSDSSAIYFLNHHLILMALKMEKKIVLLFIEAHNFVLYDHCQSIKNMCSSAELRNVSENVRRGNSKKLDLWEKHA